MNFRFQAVRFILSALAVTVGLCAESLAFSTGSPTCPVTPTTMASNEGAASVLSPGGWTLTAPVGYNAGSTLSVAIAKTNPGKQVPGIMLWATHPSGPPGGSWTSAVSSGPPPRRAHRHTPARGPRAALPALDSIQ